MLCRPGGEVLVVLGRRLDLPRPRNRLDASANTEQASPFNTASPCCCQTRSKAQNRGAQNTWPSRSNSVSSSDVLPRSTRCRCSQYQCSCQALLAQSAGQSSLTTLLERGAAAAKCPAEEANSYSDNTLNSVRCRYGNPWNSTGNSLP